MSEYPGALRVLSNKVQVLSESVKADDKRCRDFLAETCPSGHTDALSWIDERSEFVASHTAACERFEKELDKYGAQLYDFIATLSKTLASKKQDDVTDYETLSNLVPSYFRNVSSLSAKVNSARRTLSRTSNQSSSQPSAQNVPSADMQNLFAMHQQTQLQTQQLLTAINQQSNAASSAHSISNDDSTSASVKLPVLTLKKFDGNILQFTEFFDMFKSTVHANKRLSDVERLAYLRSNLVGPALEVIAGVPSTSDNYSVALRLLEDRFGSKDAIIHARYRAITELSPPSVKMGSLRKFYNDLNAHLRCLTVEGQSTDQQLLVPVIMSKLQKSVLVQLEIQKGHGTSWTVDMLCQQLSIFLDVRESAERMSADQASSAKLETVTHRPSNLPPPTAESLVTSSSKVTPKCVYCKAAHFSDTCTKYATVSARQQQLSNHCFICLKKGHWAKNCTSKRSCYHCHQSNHHRSLCSQKFPANSAMSAEAQSFTPRTHVPRQDTAATVQLQSNGVNLPTATAMVGGSAGVGDCHILFDTGSTRTFIRKSLADTLQNEIIGEDTLSIASFGATSRRTMTLPRVRVNLICQDGSAMEVIANVMPWICCPVVKSPIDLDQYPEIRQVELADTVVSAPETVEIDLLIGTDHYFDIVGTERMQLNNGLVLLSSKLGFIPAGRTDSVIGDQVHSMIAPVDEITDHEYDLKRFWRLEDIGITDDPTDVRTCDDIAFTQFKDSLRFLNGRYVVSWPWKTNFSVKPDLPDNFALAYGRLKSLHKRIQRTPDVLTKYHDTILQQLDSGVIEEVTPDMNSDDIVHYIPHHCVVRPGSATTKIRVVYDASAKANSENNSLNDCIHRGPLLLPTLCGILLRFRLQPIGIVSDVEKAFLQIGLSMPDRNVTRFLWLKDPSMPVSHSNLVTYRFCRVPFGIIASPFLLAATVDQHLERQKTPVCDDIRRSIYVDNVITGSDSVVNATQYYEQAKEVFGQASMNLREWATNDPALLSAIPDHDRCSSKVVKVLGMSWDTQHDTLSTAPTSASSHAALTKRDVLRTLSQFYDPMGLFSPVTMRAKILLQSIWKLNIGWDDHLPSDIIHTWEEIMNDLSKASDVCVPRYVGPKVLHAEIRYELHVFCDASQQGYGAAAYLRQVSGEYCSVDLIFSKTRVAPIKATSTPRMELLAALIGARLIKFLQKELPLTLDSTHLWSDSQCVLAWIDNNAKSFPVFIQNRLQEIRQVQSVSFHYVGTTDNPADVPSRGAPLSTLRCQDQWWHGPEWLQREPADIPQPNTYSAVLVAGEDPADSVKEELPASTAMPFGISANKFSSFDKLVRVSAYVMRFIRHCRHEDRPQRRALSINELESVKGVWLRHAQEQEYPQVLAALQNKGKNQLINDLDLFLDSNDVIRCKGRMEHSALPQSAKCPILLPRSHPLTTAVINDCHQKVMHSGTSHTLSRVRYRYWIPRGRQVVKAVLRKCVICKKFNGRPYSLPRFAPYPSERVTESKPFAYVGIDYFGPLNIKDVSDSQKVWVCLFSCMVTRAIHLEVVTDMTTELFIMALRRFVSRRGVPRKVFSDNAQQFHLAKSTLQLAWEQTVADEATLNYAASVGVEWIFIVQLSPWMGGFYERMVGNVKKALRKCIGRSVLSLIELLTILTETEAMVNSRPLVYVGDEIEQILTPAHFLSLSATVSLPQGTAEEDPDFRMSMSSAEHLLEVWKKGQKRLNTFWTHWRTQYLASLRERQQTELKQYAHSASTPKMGDVCLIRDDGPRGMWKIGLITELHVSNDGEVRSATVKTANNKFFRRSLKFLYPLECEAMRDQPRSQSTVRPKQQEPKLTATNKAPTTLALPLAPSSRPVRLAAVQGLARVFDLHERDLV